MRLFVVLLSATLLFAQKKPNTYRAPGNVGRERFVSPEVHPDSRVTFRLRAPKASAVELNLGGARPQSLTKGADGVWTVTLSNLTPDLYTYTFTVDGLRMLDHANPNLKTGINGLDGSLLDVPGPTPRFDAVQNVPHGAIHIRTYFSKTVNRDRGLHIYVPPQYENEPSRRFPVLYLRHGFGDTDSNWSNDGRAGVILENLIAAGKASPALIVMTYGYTDGTWAGGSSPEGIETLGKELFTDVIPFVEKHYRVAPGRANRAIAGLSMGGGQAFTIGLKNLDQFGSVAEFSSGLLSAADLNIETVVPGLLKNAAAINELRVFYIGCGTEDPRIVGHQELSELFTKNGIHHVYKETPGAHEWKVWRTLLADFLPKAFPK